MSKRPHSPPPPTSPIQRSTSPAPSYLPSSTTRRDNDATTDARSDEEADREIEDEYSQRNLQEEEEDGEDLFGEEMARDYEANAALDTYEDADLDETAYEDMDADQRRAVEQELKLRDIKDLRRQGYAIGDDPDEFTTQIAAVRRRRRLDQEEDDIDMLEQGIDPQFPIEDYKGATIGEFNRFLTTYLDNKGIAVYAERLKAMGEANKESVLISFDHLMEAEPTLAFFVVQAPKEMLPIFDETTYEVVLTIFEQYSDIHSEVKVRFVEFPTVESVRNLRYIHMNRMIQTTGVVTRRSGVFPQLKYVKFECVKCKAILGPYYQDSDKEIKVGRCGECSSQGPFSVNSEQTTYRNYQKLTLQEAPGSVLPGRLPRSKDVVLLGDLIDSARPGDEIEVIGTYMNNWDIGLNLKNGFPVFSTIIEANSILKRQDEFSSFRLTEEERATILRLSQDERISQRIIKSIAPSIYGHSNIKTAIALALFGGESKNIQNKHKIRGDINILLLGDPGTAKSQFLKYIEKTAHRAVFTTGQGASAVGLTATVRKDPTTREWTLEGGALVLADKGICLIDEFDKMNDADRTSIHEAMEQQSISISKAGIVASLQARCSVIAAANPVRGRYNASVTFQENVDLTEPILSRFDVMCVVKDVVDPLIDEQLGTFVVQSHMRSHPNATGHAEEDIVSKDADIIPQSLLRKYIVYAREKAHPKLESLDQDRIARLYADLRRESIACSSVPVTARHLESLVRMAEAHAKMHLREYVRKDDVDLAIRVMLESFIAANKFSVIKTLRKKFSKYLSCMRDNDELLMYNLNTIAKTNTQYHLFTFKQLPTEIEVDLDELEAKAKEQDIHNLHDFYESAILANAGYKVDLEDRVIRKRL